MYVKITEEEGFALGSLEDLGEGRLYPNPGAVVPRVVGVNNSNRCRFEGKS